MPDETNGDRVWDKREQLDPLALAAASDDREAFNLICKVVQPHLKRIAVALGVQYGEVADLTQDVLLFAYLNRDSFDPGRGPYRQWLLEIFFTKIYNHKRRLRRAQRLLQAFLFNFDGQHVTYPAAGCASTARLEKFLAPLSRRQRQVVVLYHLEELSASETAKILRIAPATVRSSARSALRKMRSRADAPTSKNK